MNARFAPSVVFSWMCIDETFIVSESADAPRVSRSYPDVSTTCSLQSRLADRAPKTVNNVLTVLNMLLKKAVECDVIERMPCSVRPVDQH